MSAQLVFYRDKINSAPCHDLAFAWLDFVHLTCYMEFKLNELFESNTKLWMKLKIIH